MAIGKMDNFRSSLESLGQINRVISFEQFFLIAKMYGKEGIKMGNKLLPYLDKTWFVTIILTNNFTQKRHPLSKTPIGHQYQSSPSIHG